MFGRVGAEIELQQGGEGGSVDVWMNLDDSG